MHNFAFTITNINVSNLQVVSQIHRNFKCRLKSGRISLNDTLDFPKSTHLEPGRFFGGFTTTLNSGFISSAQEPLGRWIYHTFRGKERNITIYTIYRVHRNTDDTSGLTSAWMQQRTKKREQNIMTNPWDAILNDICNGIKQDINSNRAIILMGNFNEGVISKEKSHDKLSRLGLFNIMHEQLGLTLPKKWNRGNAVLDHAYRKAGYAPFELIALSDHRIFLIWIWRCFLTNNWKKSNRQNFANYNFQIKNEWRSIMDCYVKNGITIR